MTEPIIKVRGLHKYFGPLHVIKGVDLDVMPGEVVVIIGPSGGGKSTFLRSVGLAVVFSHLGLPVPAQRLRLRDLAEVLARVPPPADGSTARRRRSANRPCRWPWSSRPARPRR